MIFCHDRGPADGPQSPATSQEQRQHSQRQAATESLQLEERPVHPIEFAAAAYRFGHSMVRPIRGPNTELGSDATEDQKDQGNDVFYVVERRLRESGRGKQHRSRNSPFTQLDHSHFAKLQ